MRGVLGSLLGMISGGATHVGVATDHVIESFRNRLWPGYKTGAGHRPRAARAVPAARGGARPRSAFVVWPMIEFEADDALAAAAAQRRRAIRASTGC